MACNRCGSVELPTVCLGTYDDSDEIAWTGDTPEAVIAAVSGNLLECRANGLYAAMPSGLLSARFTRVYRTSDQSISASTGSALSFTTELIDTLGAWAIGAPTRLTAPVNGFYEFGASVAVDLQATDRDVSIDLRRNGSTNPLARRMLKADDSTICALLVSTEHELTAGQYIEAFVSLDAQITTARNALASPEVSPVAWMNLRAAI